MSIYSNEIGSYIDPGLITPQDIVIGPNLPSMGGEGGGLNRVIPLPDGRNAIVDSEGLIIGYK